jgi:hypothetical protein
MGSRKLVVVVLVLLVASERALALFAFFSLRAVFEESGTPEAGLLGPAFKSSLRASLDEKAYTYPPGTRIALSRRRCKLLPGLSQNRSR